MDTDKKICGFPQPGWATQGPRLGKNELSYFVFSRSVKKQGGGYPMNGVQTGDIADRKILYRGFARVDADKTKRPQPGAPPPHYAQNRRATGTPGCATCAWATPQAQAGIDCLRLVKVGQ